MVKLIRLFVDKRTYHKGIVMYRKRNKGWLKHLDFAVLDLMCMQICLALAYFGRHRELSRLYSDSVYQNVVLLLAVFEFVYLFL